MSAREQSSLGTAARGEISPEELQDLMAGGQEGVRRVIELLAKEVEVAMSLMGAATTADLTPASVRAPWLEG